MHTAQELTEEDAQVQVLLCRVSLGRDLMVGTPLKTEAVPNGCVRIKRWSLSETQSGKVLRCTRWHPLSEASWQLQCLFALITQCHAA